MSNITWNRRGAFRKAFMLNNLQRFPLTHLIRFFCLYKYCHVLAKRPPRMALEVENGRVCVPVCRAAIKGRRYCLPSGPGKLLTWPSGVPRPHSSGCRTFGPPFLNPAIHLPQSLFQSFTFLLRNCSEVKRKAALRKLSF